LSEPLIWLITLILRIEKKSKIEENQRNRHNPKNQGFRQKIINQKSEIQTGIMPENKIRSRLKTISKDSLPEQKILHILAQNAPVLLRMTDPDGNFNFFSQQWLKFTGRTREQEQNGGWIENLHRQDAECFEEEWQKALAKKQRFEVTYRLRKHTLEYAWVLETASPYFDEQNMFQGYVTSVIDLTEQRAGEEVRQQEQVFRETEDKFHQTIANINLCGITIRRDGTISFINKFMLKTTGYTEAEILGKDFFQVFVSKAERENRRADFEQAFLNQGILSSVERTVKAKDGSLRYILFRSYILNNHLGEISGITRIGEDVTEKREVEKNLSRTNAQLQDLFDNANDLIQIFSLKGDVLFANKAWKNKLGYTDAEIQNLNLINILHPNYLKNTVRRLKRVLRGDVPSVFETVFVSKEGKSIFLEGSVTCRYEHHKPTAFRCILYDVTDRLRAEKAQQLYYRIGALVTQSFNLENLYQNIHAELGKIIDARNFYITLSNPESSYLHFPYYVDEGLETDLRLTQRRAGKGLIEYGLSQQKPLILFEEDIKKLIDEDKVELYNNLPKVWLGVPLRIENRTIGFVSLRSYQTQSTYDEKDLELLDFISGQIALSIERKQTEERLSKQTAKLNAIFESGKHLMWSVNRKFYLTSFNNNYADFLESYYGVRPDLQKNPDKMRSALVNDKYYWLWEEKYNQAFQGISQYFEIKTREKENAHQTIWWEIYLNPIFLPDGSLEEVSAIAHNITEKKRNEIALRESESKFRDIFESFQDIYYRSDLHGMVSMISPSILEVLGYEPLEVIGKPTSIFLPDHHTRKNALHALLRTGFLKNFESQLRTRTGETIPFLFNIRLIYDENGQPAEVEGVARDISELRKSSEDLRLAKEMAEKSLKVKESFLANMSHEIRTPMNGIIGMIDLLADSQLDERQQDYVQTVKKSSETLLTILNDILDLSKIEAGKMSLSRTPLSLSELIDKLYTLFSQQAIAKNNRLTYKIQSGVPKYIIGDETRLLQVFSNFASNAIKFTENGKILIYISTIAQRDNWHRLKVEIVDTGIGIAREKVDLLFQNFSQVDNSSSKSYGGTGLGLSISKALIELMDGEVGVDSVPNRGSTFWFTFEAEATNVSPSSLPSSEGIFRSGELFGSYKPLILLTDDNPVNQKVASEILSKSGCEVETAESGEEAIRKIQNRSGKPYDLIFMDIQMPGLDGVETTRLLRNLNLPDLPPIIAMTAYAMKEDRERFIQAGMDDYLPKPIKAHLLVQKVKDWMMRKSQRGGVPEISLPGEIEPKLPEAEPKIINRLIVNQMEKYIGVEGVKALLEEFMEEAQEFVRQSLIAYRNGDIRQIISHLHTLKGNAGTLGADKLSAQAAFVEKQLKTDPTTDITAGLRQLELDFEAFKKAAP
jgi:PAS domain S-box-containing protein